MQEAYINANPLIRSVVHKPFTEAIRSIGLPAFPQLAFTDSISPYLHVPGSLFEDDEHTRAKLWNSVMHGEVIATDVWDDMPVFYVRGGFGGRCMDVRLIYRDRQWALQSVVSMHHRPLMRTPWFLRLVTIAAIVVAGILGYVLHQPKHAPTPAVNAMPTTQPKIPSTTPATKQDAKTQPSTQKNTTAPTKTKTAKPPTPTTFTFTLEPGMPLNDLSKFLNEHHLFSGIVKFDMAMKNTHIDQAVRPGKYTFKTGMSEKQLLQVLKNGPNN
ncbi:hypothetical protein [Alicyclobacillus fodiniaquatilis]|jgi:hypothetical protein|uniref:Uncharacterized protein n=1 Tax=Alicyclobacillus fodiniaquatilis TaxID=1661150 RepID=A0ABW4JJD3_9BACL